MCVFFRTVWVCPWEAGSQKEERGEDAGLKRLPWFHFQFLCWVEITPYLLNGNSGYDNQ